MQCYIVVLDLRSDLTIDKLHSVHSVHASVYLVCKDDQSEPLCICLATIILS